MFQEERTSYRQNFPYPCNNEVIFENPPTFIWIPEENAEYYIVKLYDWDKKLIAEEKTDNIYLNINKKLENKDYYWTVETDKGDLRELYKFTVSEDAVYFEKPSGKKVFENIPNSRPFHLFTKDDIKDFLINKKEELSILEKNKEIAFKQKKFPFPEFHKDDSHISYIKYFGKLREYCDRDLIALSLLYAIKGDKEAGLYAKKLLLDICDINPLGASSFFSKYGDELGLSISRCLPSAFDLLYDLLNDYQRKVVARTMALYGYQLEKSIIENDYIKKPSDSHLGRYPGYLGEIAIALKNTDIVPDDILISWIDLAIEIYGGIFPYYGCSDGSWAEGSFYSTSYTKWYLPFFSLVNRLTGVDLMNRPFYHRFTNFLIHFCNPDYEIHPFGDGYWADSDSDEWPGFFAQNPFRIYADKFGPEEAVLMSKNCKVKDYYRLHLLDLFLPCKKNEHSLAKKPQDVEVFQEGGFIAIHKNLFKDDDICILVRASKFGSDSHRHADQGSFAIFCNGISLVTPSGYYGKHYGSDHHFKWTNTTKAHNTLLFDDMGQETDSITSKGKIIDVNKENKSCIIDLSSAYCNIDLWQREITLKDNVIYIKDVVEAKNPVSVTYPLHFFEKPKEYENGIEIIRKNINLKVVPEDNNLYLFKITDKYDVEICDNENETCEFNLKKQYHAYFKTDKKTKHVIKVKYIIDKK